MRIVSKLSAGGSRFGFAKQISLIAVGVNAPFTFSHEEVLIFLSSVRPAAIGAISFFPFPCCPGPRECSAPVSIASGNLRNSGAVFFGDEPFQTPVMGQVEMMPVIKAAEQACRKATRLEREGRQLQYSGTPPPAKVFFQKGPSKRHPIDGRASFFLVHFPADAELLFQQCGRGEGGVSPLKICPWKMVCRPQRNPKARSFCPNSFGHRFLVSVPFFFCINQRNGRLFLFFFSFFPCLASLLAPSGFSLVPCAPPRHASIAIVTGVLWAYQPQTRRPKVLVQIPANAFYRRRWARPAPR